MVGAASKGLPGTYKIGVWYNSGRFDDQRFDNTGLSLANPASSGIPQTHHGDYSFYAVADQMVWRPDPDEPRSVGVFARVMGAPGDRNLVSISANLGVVMKAPFAGRDNDSVGLALAYIKVGNHAHDSITTTARFTRRPVRRAHERNRARSDLSVSGHAVVDHPGRRAVHVQRRRRAEPERSDATAAQHVRHRRAHQHHFLMLRAHPYATKNRSHAFDHDRNHRFVRTHRGSIMNHPTRKF